MFVQASLKIGRRNNTVEVEAKNEKVVEDLYKKFTKNEVINCTKILHRDYKKSVENNKSIPLVTLIVSTKKYSVQFIFHNVKVSKKRLYKLIKRYISVNGEKITHIFDL